MMDYILCMRLNDINVFIIQNAFCCMTIIGSNNALKATFNDDLLPSSSSCFRVY